MYCCREHGRADALRRHHSLFVFFMTRLEELERLEKDYLTSEEIDGYETSELKPPVSKERVQQIVAEMGAQMGDRGNMLIYPPASIAYVCSI